MIVICISNSLSTTGRIKKKNYLSGNWQRFTAQKAAEFPRANSSILKKTLALLDAFRVGISDLKKSQKIQWKRLSKGGEKKFNITFVF